MEQVERLMDWRTPFTLDDDEDGDRGKTRTPRKGKNR
jgi:hypothetical protein